MTKCATSDEARPARPLYALSSPSNVAADATGDDVVALLAGLGAITTTLTGTYTGL